MFCDSACLIDARAFNVGREFNMARAISMAHAASQTKLRQSAFGTCVPSDTRRFLPPLVKSAQHVSCTHALIVAYRSYAIAAHAFAAISVLVLYTRPTHTMEFDVSAAYAFAAFSVVAVTANTAVAFACDAFSMSTLI